MKIIGDCGKGIHAPANSRASFLSAYVAGADALRVSVRLTRDERAVIAEEDEVSRLTGETGKITELSLEQLRRLDFGRAFTDSAGTSFAYPARIETFGMLLDVLPEDLHLLVEIRPEPDAQRATRLVERIGASLRRRGRASRSILASGDPEILAIARKTAPGIAVVTRSPGQGVREALAAAEAARADGVEIELEGFLKEGSPDPEAARIAGRFEDGSFRVGAILAGGASLSPADHAGLKDLPWIWGVTLASPLSAASLFRPAWVVLEEPWDAKAAEHQDVNTDLWRLGYAKHNEPPYAHVYPDRGIHVDLKPFQGEVEHRPGKDPVKEQLHALLERSWYALKDWPFYSGGGVGFAPGVEGDFSAEVDVSSETARQATTVEMAAVNVDPATHRKPWVQDAKTKEWRPNPPASFRDAHTFYDPHGCPPFAGVEHDEDDGWRINWNLGSEYSDNQYGRAVGDGKILSGRMRLDRRGPYFAAYFRPSGSTSERDWICVGATRNDSLNRKVYLRMAGKRWRQEDPAEPSRWLPVIPNHFVFRSFRLVRYRSEP
jgi:glycerophosphoryl diester phosphodiesterase